MGRVRSGEQGEVYSAQGVAGSCFLPVLEASLLCFFFLAGLLPGSVLSAVWVVWAVFYMFYSVFYSLPFTHSFDILDACANEWLTSSCRSLFPPTPPTIAAILSHHDAHLRNLTAPSFSSSIP